MKESTIFNLCQRNSQFSIFSDLQFLSKEVTAINMYVTFEKAH